MLERGCMTVYVCSSVCVFSVCVTYSMCYIQYVLHTVCIIMYVLQCELQCIVFQCVCSVSVYSVCVTVCVSQCVIVCVL